MVNGQGGTKVIYKLDDGEEKYYKSLGTGSGISLMHCLAMGINHKEELWVRVFTYKIKQSDDIANLLNKATNKSYISV